MLHYTCISLNVADEIERLQQFDEGTSGIAILLHLKQVPSLWKCKHQPQHLNIRVSLYWFD